MTTQTEHHNAPIRELDDADLGRVSGGTSGMIYAVAQAALKSKIENETLTFGKLLAADMILHGHHD
jgi:hypothetical protein